MPNSLTKTTVALLLAAFAVLITAGLAMRDFVRDVRFSCPGTFERQEERLRYHSATPPKLELMPLHFVNSWDVKNDVMTDSPSFRVVIDKSPSWMGPYANGQLEWLVGSADGMCNCGSVPVAVADRDAPSLTLWRVLGTANEYVVRQGSSEIAWFHISETPVRSMQSARIISRRHLSLGVSFLAFLALGVAWLRQRKARAYALTMHAWREAELTSGQMIQNESGEMLGTLASTSRRIWQRAGKVLVAPEALGSSGLYRDVPVIEPRWVARGTHEEWARATMIRLRDARALAAISTFTAVLAFVAHAFA